MNGNVGIGTISPGYKLDVEGYVQAYGYYTGDIIFQKDGQKLWRMFEKPDALHTESLTTGQTVLTIKDNGNVGIGTTNPTTKFAVAGLTGTASYNLVRVDTATGNFYYDSSSERYKDNIRLFETDFYKILEASPKLFTDKASGHEEIGFIAEEFANVGLGQLVIYDKDGQPNGLKYDKIPLYLLEVAKKQNQEIQAIKQELGLGDLNLEGGFGPEPSPGFVERIKQVLAKLGLVIENGIARLQEVITGKITTQQLCVDDVCVTRDQLKALLERNTNYPALPASRQLPISNQPPISNDQNPSCLLYTSPSPRDGLLSRMPSSA